MPRDAWIQRLAQAEDIVKSGKNQIKAIEKLVDALLGRIIHTTNPTVIRAYEGKTSELERSKTKLQDQLTRHSAPTKNTFEENLNQPCNSSQALGNYGKSVKSSCVVWC
jgi:hypothetical protein